MKKRPLYPFLFAGYLVAAFAAENRELIIRPLEFGRTLALALAVAATGWLAARLFTRQTHRRALVALVFVAAFSLFARIRIELSVWTPAALQGALPGFVAWLMLFTAAALAIARLAPQRSLANVTRFLDLTAAIVLVFPLLALLAPRRAGAAPHADAAPAETVVDLPLPAAAPRADPPPDIYLIVVDQYTRTDALRDNYGFDNTPFERALDSLGFFVPQSAHANYVHTILSLASLLNWTHLHGVAAALGAGSRDTDPIHELIESNRAVHFLRASGYRFVFLPTSFPATAANRYADASLRPAPRAGARLADAWLRTTPLGPLRDWQCRRTGCLQNEFPYEIESARRNEWKLRQLAAMPERADGPVFVLAHLLLPHEPYLFRADCTHRKPYWPRAAALRDSAVAEAYTDQTSCLNRKLLTVVREILQRSERPPVVLIQSDHGHGRIPRDHLGLSLVPFEQLDPAQVRERLSVFAAYYLPPAPAGAPQPYHSISPVNVLPLVFNRYLGTAIPPLEDDAWWSDYGGLYDFTRIDLAELSARGSGASDSTH